MPRLFGFLLISCCIGLAACSRTANATADGSSNIDWVAISGGCFTLGEDTIYREETPTQTACVDDFLIARTEITNAQFAAFVTATGYVTRAEKGWQATESDGPGIDMVPASAVFVPPSTAAPRNLSWWKLIDGANWQEPLGPDAPNEALDNAPVVHITRRDAEAYAAWAGGRLPTEAEWEYAARGGLDATLYAWPDVERQALTEKANTWQGIFPVADVGEDGHRGVAPVAQYPANGYGLYDMIGNVWEWTASPYTPSHLPADQARAGANGLDPTQPGIPVGTIKGGSFLCARSYCYRFRPAARQAQDLAFGTSHIGFRIVRDPS